MLKFLHMNMHSYRLVALIGLTCLLSSAPIIIASAAGARDEAVSYRIQGYEAQQQGDKATALALYQKAITTDPTYAAPYNDLGILMEDEGRLEDAAQLYEKALTVQPDYLEAHANLGMLYERLGNKEQAIAHWMKRYRMGDSQDPWTSRAAERLMALGVLTEQPGGGVPLYTRQYIVGQELMSHAQSLAEFHTITKEHGDWP